MVRANIRFILRNRLTWISFLIILIASLSICFYNIINIYKNFTPYMKENIGLVTKPYAANELVNYSFFNSFSSVLIMSIPLLVCTNLYINEPFEKICTIRNLKIKHNLAFSLATSMITFMFIFLIYFLSVTSFYLSMNYGVEENSGLNIILNDYLFNSLMKNNDNSYLLFMIIGLITSFIAGTIIFGLTTLISIVPNRYKIAGFIVLAYVVIFLEFMIIEKTKFFSIVEIMYWFEHSDKEMLSSIFGNITINFCLSLLSITLIIVKKEVIKNE